MCFLWRVKNQESLICFLDVFLCVFWCLDEEKMCRKPRQRAKLSQKKNGLPQVWRVPRAFYSPNMNFKAATSSLSRAASFKLPHIRLIITPLERSWLPIFEKVWNLKIQWSDKKLWLFKVSGASIDASSWFSWYLSPSNSNFD